MQMKAKLLVLGWILICPAIIFALCILSIKGMSTISASSRLSLIYCAALVLWSALSLLIDYIVRLKKVHGYFSKRTVFNMVLIISFILTILQPLIGLTLGVEGRLPNYERQLAGRPVLNTKALTSYPHDVEAYINDHLGFRKMLINWNSVARVTYLKTSSVPDVVLGKDNWLFYEPSLKDSQGSTSFTEGELLTIRNNIEERKDWLAERDIAYLIVIPPNKETIYPEYLPNTVRTVNQQTRLDQLLDYLQSNSDVQVLDLRPALLQAKAMHTVYYKTDTHWNSYGAFVGYCEIMKQLSVRFPVLSVPWMSEYQVVPEAGYGPQGLSHALSMPDTWLDQEIHNVILDDNELSNQTKLKSAVVFADSFFFSGLEPYFSRNFESVITPGMWQPFDYNMIETEQPDMVMELWVERDTPFLLKATQHVWTSSLVEGMSLPAQSHDSTFNIDSSKEVTQDGNKVIEIAGWAFINGQSSENSKIYVVLQSDSNTYVFDTLPQYKPDVTAYYHTLSLNLDESGFLARIPKDNIGNATYRIGVYVEKDGIEALGWSGNALEK